MPHRRLLSPPKIDLEAFVGKGGGGFVSATISEDSREFSSKSWRASEQCVICGITTTETDRLPATLHPTIAHGACFAIGVWVHHSCFQQCAEAGIPTPIPW
jgi:hypothetical protein